MALCIIAKVGKQEKRVEREKKRGEEQSSHTHNQTQVATLRCTASHHPGEKKNGRKLNSNKTLQLKKKRSK
jgi:hypothetical protein